LDAAITENLQREDVSAMEEARAFAALIEKGHTLQALGERFGKSHVHIWNRVKLAATISEVQQAIENDEIPLSYARELARFPAEVQRIELGTARWNNVRSPKEYIERIVNKGSKISKAVFDIEKAGCATCEFNTKVMGVSDEAVCLNAFKFDQHSGEFVLEMLERNPHLIPIKRTYTEVSAGLAKKLPRAVVTVGWSEAFDVVPTPDDPELEELDREDYDSEEEYQEALQEAKGTYDEEFQDYLANLREYNEKLVNAKKGIYVDNYAFGEVVVLEPNGNGKAASKAANDPAIPAELAALKEEEVKLILKAQRIPSLAAEKVYNEQTAQIKELASYKGVDSLDQPPLARSEDDLLYMYMLKEIGYHMPPSLRRLLLKSSSTIDAGNIENVLKLKNQLWPQVVRIFLKQRCMPSEGKGAGYYELQGWNWVAAELHDVAKQPIEQIKQKYKKQLEQVESRLKELQDAIALFEAAPIEELAEGGQL
jgi:ParB family chromosome partitioning protein